MISLSVVIPAFEAERTIAETIAAVTGGASEVVVVDGGSVDRTEDVAREAGARVVSAARGRGTQLAAGAAAARGDWLMFLHADTRPEDGWEHAVATFIAETGDTPRAGAFRFALDDRSPSARRVERFVAWRCRTLGLPYGDQGLLMSRRFYESLGGFRPMPLFEDVDIVRRIGRNRIGILPAGAVTSAARYRQSGYVLRPLRNFFLLSLYFCGVPPRLLARLYC